MRRFYLSSPFQRWRWRCAQALWRWFTCLLVLCGLLGATGRLALAADFDPEYLTPPLHHGTFLWKGFDHFWGKYGHRIGNHASFVSDQSITDTAGVIRAKGQAVMKLSVGKNGDYAQPRVLYNFVYARKIGVARGHVAFTFRSDIIPGLFPVQSAAHVLTKQWRQSLLTPALRYGTFDHYAAVLQGFDVTVQCPDDQRVCQPASWLRDFGIALDNCALQGTEYACDTHLYLHRYHAPDALRGLPKSVLYQVKVYYTLLGGAAADFASTAATPVRMQARLKDDNPVLIQHERVTGQCRVTDAGCSAAGGRRYEVATMGILGFRYQLNRLPDGPPALGRYMKRVTFQLTDLAYDPNSGTMDYRVAYDYIPGVPLAYDSQVEYQSTARLLQFRHANILGDREASGVVCQYAPLIMGFQRCVGRFDPTYTYPKLQDAVPITN